MQIDRTRIVAMGIAVFAIACASQPVVTTTTTSGGDVALEPVGGYWLDSVGGTWVDTTGGYYVGGLRGMRMGLDDASLRTLNNANIVAHLAAGDSLEVSLSQAGVSHAQNSAVRDFAQRMVNEHSSHLQMTRQMASQAGITPMPALNDTADVAMSSRMMSRLSSTPASASYDRQFMRAEVAAHQHMLGELNVLRPQATGTALELIDHTLPVVRQHLSDAQSIYHQIGGRDWKRDGSMPNP